MRFRNIFFLFLFLFLISFSSARVFEEDETFYVEQELKDEWNLIAGISFSDEVHSTSEIVLGDIISSYYHDSKTGEDVEIRPIYNAEDIDPLILYSNAFWVFSFKEGKIVYKASPSFIDKNRIGGDYDFYFGWNAIAINEEMYGKSIQSLKGDCDIIEARVWDAETQDWSELGINEDLNFDSKDLLVGKGISIKVSGDCAFLKGKYFGGDYTGFYDFPDEFFNGSILSEKEITSIADMQYLALKDLHNEDSPYNFARIEYKQDVYGETAPNGMKIGDSASPSENSGNLQWAVLGHEQGHNFFGGTSSFYWDVVESGPFIQESFAVLSTLYTYNYALENKDALDISDKSMGSLDFIFDEERTYQEEMYEKYVNESNFDIEEVLTSQALDYKMITYGENYGWENYKKLSRAFSDEMSDYFSFQDDGTTNIEKSTYVIASLSASFGRDFKDEFIELNFPIDNDLHDEFVEILEGIFINPIEEEEEEEEEDEEYSFGGRRSAEDSESGGGSQDTIQGEIDIGKNDELSITEENKLRRNMVYFLIGFVVLIILAIVIKLVIERKKYQYN